MPQSPMLLIAGRGLAGASATIHYPGIRVARVQSQPAGHYLFVWLQLSPNVKPGTAKLHIGGANGSATTIDFPLLARTGHKPAGLSRDDLIYLIMPDRFADGDTANDNPPEAPGQTDRSQSRKWHGGDIKGVTSHLAYLKQLGVTAVWLTPWWKQATSTSDYHGYGAVDFYAVDPHLGTVSELQQLAAEAHRQGIKIIIDYVANHTGPLHPWVQDPPTASWLHGTVEKHLEPKYDFWPLVDPHAPPSASRNVLEGWFANTLPDLNPDDPLLATYLLQNAEWWMESSAADGFRLDTFPYSSRRFWSGWHKGIFAAYPNASTIGEVWNFDPIITSFFQGGRTQYDGIDTGVSTLFDFPFFNTIREVVLRGGSAKKFAELFQCDALYPNPNALVTFIGNHDTKRFMGETGATPAKMKAAFSLLMTVRGIPQIYAGDEIGMEGGDDPDNRRDFPGGFAGDAHNAFTNAGRTPQQQEIFAHLELLSNLRREHPALRGGKQWDLAAEDKYFAFVRESGQDVLLVLFNNSEDYEQINLKLDDTPLENIGKVTPILNAGAAKLEGKTLQIKAMPNAVLIFQVTLPAAEVK